MMRLVVMKGIYKGMMDAEHWKYSHKINRQFSVSDILPYDEDPNIRTSN